MMVISELVDKLEEIKAAHGDLPICAYTYTDDGWFIESSRVDVEVLAGRLYEGHRRDSVLIS